MYLDVSEDNSLKEKILHAITRKLHLEEGLDLSDVALRCPSHATGADLYALCSSATICALRREIQRLEDEGRIDKLVYMYTTLYLCCSPVCGDEPDVLQAWGGY